MTPNLNEHSPPSPPDKKGDFAQGFLRLVGALPILGPLTNCSRKNHKDSIKEFLVTIFFGTATFWVTALFLMAFNVNADKSYIKILTSTIATGQLFIFSVGMLGPIVLASAEDPDSSKQFPGRTYHFALIVLLGALASGFYAFVLASREPQAAGLLNADFLLVASIVIASVVVVMRYLTTVYRKSTTSFDAEDRLKGPVNDFAERFNSRHGGEATLADGLAAPNDADSMIARFNDRKGGPQ